MVSIWVTWLFYRRMPKLSWFFLFFYLFPMVKYTFKIKMYLCKCKTSYESSSKYLDTFWWCLSALSEYNIFELFKYLCTVKLFIRIFWVQNKWKCYTTKAPGNRAFIFLNITFNFEIWNLKKKVWRLHWWIMS